MGGYVAEVPDKNIVLYQPDTYMNVCGQSIKKAMKKYGMDAD